MDGKDNLSEQGERRKIKKGEAPMLPLEGD